MYVFKNDNTCQGCDGNDLYGKRDDPISNFAPSASREKILDAGRELCKRPQISSEGSSKRRGTSRAQKVVDEEYRHKPYSVSWKSTYIKMKRLT